MTEQELHVFLYTKAHDFAYLHGDGGRVVVLDEPLCNTPTYKNLSDGIEISCEILFNDIHRKAKEGGKPARDEFFALRKLLIAGLRQIPDMLMGEPKAFRVYVKLGFIDRAITQIDQAPVLWQTRLDDFVAL